MKLFITLSLITLLITIISVTCAREYELVQPQQVESANLEVDESGRITNMECKTKGGGGGQGRGRGRGRGRGGGGGHHG